MNATNTRKRRTPGEKLDILKQAEGSPNISEICRLAGISRSSFYEMKKAYEQAGPAGLESKPRKTPAMPNAFSEEIVRKILDMTAKFPTYSCQRISQKLGQAGVAASGSGVRKVWKRHGLTTKELRLNRLRRALAEGEAVILGLSQDVRSPHKAPHNS